MRHLRKFFPVEALQLSKPNSFVLKEYVGALFVNGDDRERVLVVAELQSALSGEQLNRLPSRAR